MQTWPRTLGPKVCSVQSDPAPDEICLSTTVGINNGEGFRVALREVGTSQQPQGASISTPGREGDITRERSLKLQLMGPVLMILKAAHEQEVPSNPPKEHFSHNTPDLSSAERESEAQNQGERDDQGTVTERPLEAPPERLSEGGHIGEGVHAAVQLGIPRGECQCRGSIPACINLYQFRIETVGTRHSRPPPFS